MKTAPLKQKIQIVTIAQKQVLLLEFARFYPGGFQNITGSVEEGETFEAGALRELSEEIGITADLINIEMNFQFADRWGNEVVEKVFLCQLKNIPNITLSEEHTSFKWVPIENVKPEDFVFPSNFLALKKALEYYHA